MIRFRALEREDLKQLRDWRNAPEIFSRVREYRYLNMENQEAWFNSLRDDRKTIMFGVDHSLIGSFVGVCGLTGIDWIGRKAEVSIYIGNKEDRQKGLGLEILNALSKYAFEECNLNRLWAEVFDSNQASRRLFIKAGYKEEGVLLSNAYKNGHYQNSHIYRMLKDEWQENDVP